MDEELTNRQSFGNFSPASCDLLALLESRRIKGNVSPRATGGLGRISQRLGTRRVITDVDCDFFTEFLRSERHGNRYGSGDEAEEIQSQVWIHAHGVTAVEIVESRHGR